jgi:hypothetical protein
VWEFIDPSASFSPTLRRLKLTSVSLFPPLLKLRTLTELDLSYSLFPLHLDTLLDFLEENHLLESATLKISWEEPSLRSSRRRTPIKNRLQYLNIRCYDALDGQALISSIALSKGADSTFTCDDADTGVNDILCGISTTHLSNLLSPTYMEYRAYMRDIRMVGLHGSARFSGRSPSDIPFVEFPRLPLTNVRQLHLTTSCWDMIEPPPGPAVFHHLSFFPALETLVIGFSTDLSRLLSALFSNPSSLPSLKTLAFLGCIVTGKFMEELMRFALDRKNTASAPLHYVAIFHRQGKFPNVASIRKLEEHVSVVDVRIAKELPVNLT